jgi:hypothetical protein
MGEPVSDLPAMNAAVDRWIEEAKAHADGPFHLRRRSLWLDDMLKKLAAAIDRDMEPPPPLRGVTVPDIHSAQARLLVAARDIEEGARG